MEPIQVAEFLNRMAMGDNRKIEKSTVAYWYDVIGDLDFRDAMEAVRRHRMTSDAYLMPVHVREGVKRIRHERVDAHVKEIPPYPDPDDVAAEIAHRKAWTKRLADGETPPQPAIGTAPLPPLAHIAKSPPRADEPARRRSPLDVTCPWCGALPGHRCTSDGREKFSVHDQRRTADSTDADAQRRHTEALEAERQRQLRALEAIATVTQPQQDAGDEPR